MENSELEVERSLRNGTEGKRSEESEGLANMEARKSIKKTLASEKPWKE